MLNFMSDMWGNTHKKNAFKNWDLIVHYIRVFHPGSNPVRQQASWRNLCAICRVKLSPLVERGWAWLKRGQQRTPHSNMCSHRLKSIMSKCSQDCHPSTHYPHNGCARAETWPLVLNRSHVMMTICNHRAAWQGDWKPVREGIPVITFPCWQRPSLHVCSHHTCYTDPM